ncbi:MAG: hypothetical protein ACT4QA_04790 [Panacagrimonas sp.]
MPDGSISLDRNFLLFADQQRIDGDGIAGLGIVESDLQAVAGLHLQPCVQLPVVGIHHQQLVVAQALRAAGVGQQHAIGFCLRLETAFHRELDAHFAARALRRLLEGIAVFQAGRGVEVPLGGLGVVQFHPVVAHHRRGAGDGGQGIGAADGAGAQVQRAVGSAFGLNRPTGRDRRYRRHRRSGQARVLFAGGPDGRGW